MVRVEGIAKCPRRGQKLRKSLKCFQTSHSEFAKDYASSPAVSFYEEIRYESMKGLIR